MQQRRVRLGDILDDYCPRERRITNHAVVAMIDDEVKQTRCTTCDADHEYKHARVPPQRRKRPLAAPPAPALLDHADTDSPPAEDAPLPELPAVELPADGLPEPPSAAAAAESEVSADTVPEEDGPVHRRLIRATLPRPEGQIPERREPEFTMRQPGFRGRPFDKNGPRHGRRPMRAQGGSQPQRFGPPRQGSGQAPRHGSGQGSGGPGFRPGGNRPGHPGGPRGPRHGGGRGGRKRGR